MDSKSKYSFFKNIVTDLIKAFKTVHKKFWKMKRIKFEEAQIE